jgi:ribose 5-phosphate isomerase B
MKVGLASDHRGYNLKERLKEALNNLGYETLDCGTNSVESTDYPDYAFLLGDKVVKKEVDFGVAICGTGIGISIACNKVKGIRCAKVDSIDDVMATRIDNDANIIAFGEKVPFETALEWVTTFVRTETSNEEKHVRRRNKIARYEESL